jgi:hypothetical protein
MMSSTGDSVPRAAAAQTHRIGGLTIEQYAEACVARERELDAAGILLTRSGIHGRAEDVWPRLSAHAARYGVPLTIGDLSRTNRIPEWDELIATSRHALVAWKDAYARALVRAHGIDPDTIEGRARVEILKRSDEIFMNPLVPLERRRSGLTGLAARSTDNRAKALEPSAVVEPASDRMDPVVFPGEKLARVSDFVRIELAMRNEDLADILDREEIDPKRFEALQLKWAQLLRKDAWLAEKHRVLLERARAGAPAPLARVPVPFTPPPMRPEPADATAELRGDPVVFPGEKLSKLSDFVRLALAARENGFLGVLHREGIHPSYYAHMCKRFDAARKADAVLDRAYRAMMESS